MYSFYTGVGYGMIADILKFFCSSRDLNYPTSGVDTEQQYTHSNTPKHIHTHTNTDTQA